MKSPSLQIGKFTFDWGTHICDGHLNVTPILFGDGVISKGDVVQAALSQADEFIASGADILDVGGESTRPGSAPVPADEELERVMPVIHALHKTFPDALISIDTYKASVAQEALKAGAQIVNDVWGLRADPELAFLVAKYKAPVILMHNHSNPASLDVREKLGSAYIGSEYQNLIEDVKRDCLKAWLCKTCRVAESQIV